MTAPPPGRIPTSDPSAVPRAIAPAESMRSWRVGIRPVIFAWTMSRLSAGSSRLRMISAKPNTPMAMLAKPMPSASSGMSKVMRPAPVSRSEPTIESSKPVSTMATALSTEPLASTTAKIRPSTISEKYSAGPNSSARLVSGWPRAATSTVATQPAKNEPIAAMESAGLPRHLVAVEAGNDGGGFTRDVDQHRGGRAAVLCTVVDAREHDQRADRRQAEGDRQQHRDGGDRADAGQNADQGANQRAEQAEQDIEWIGRDLKAHPEVREKVRHDLLTPESVEARPKLERQVEQVDEQQHAKQRHQRPGDRAFDPPHFR